MAQHVWFFLGPSGYNKDHSDPAVREGAFGVACPSPPVSLLLLCVCFSSLWYQAGTCIL